VRWFIISAKQKIAARSNHQLHAMLLCSNMRAHDPGHGVTISDRHCAKPKLRRTGDDLFRMACTFQEGEVAESRQFTEWFIFKHRIDALIICTVFVSILNQGAKSQCATANTLTLAPVG
jgi:hypothetical protein